MIEEDFILSEDKSEDLVSVGVPKSRASYTVPTYPPCFTFSDLMAMMPKEIDGVAWSSGYDRFEDEETYLFACGYTGIYMTRCASPVVAMYYLVLWLVRNDHIRF